MGPFVWNDKDQFGAKFSKPVTIENGCTYIGQFDKEGNRCGRGICIWTDGAKFTGYWKNNKANGRGRLIHKDGDVYEG